MSGVHSVPRSKGWAIHRTGAKRATRLFRDEAACWQEAKALARSSGVIAYRHGRDGRVVERVEA